MTNIIIVDKNSKEEVIAIGAFYELPDGTIINAVQYDAQAGTIGFMCDDNLGLRTVEICETKTWKKRLDLGDFPNARDPRLPYVFDLLWDIKTMSQLKAELAAGHVDEDEIRDVMKTRGIVLTS